MATDTKLDQFKKALRKGKYLFHIHTNWTDGKSSLTDYCVVARKLRFQTLIFTEHIRQGCSYDFHAFLKLANEQQSLHGVEVIVGVEAKVLPNEFVDVPEQVLSKIGVLAIAEHSFKGDASALAKSLCQAFDSLRNAGFARVWVHPGLGLFLKKDASESTFLEVLRTALECGVYIEHNLRYKLPPEPFLSLIPPTYTVIGLDAHSVGDVEVLAEEVLQKESELASAI